MHTSLIFINGLALGAGLIVAIGAQNAYLLSRALRNQHQYAVALFCSITDASLICLGIFGMGYLVHALPDLLLWISWGGVVFLFNDCRRWTLPWFLFWKRLDGGIVDGGEVKGTFATFIYFCTSTTCSNRY